MGDVYLGLSRLEGLGLPLIEAQACGLAVVTCDHPPMNEFITEGLGSVAKIDRLWSRNDGYYWPQCAPNIQSLTEILDFHAGQFDHIRELKQAVRRHAEEKFNWIDRSKLINDIISGIAVDHVRKTNAVKQALNFERSSQGIMYRTALNYPLLWNMYQQIKKK